MFTQGASVKLARLDLGLRRERRILFGPSIAGPDGWDFILILYLADADGRRLTVAQVIEQAGGCPDAGKRRIAYLSHARVIVGDGDGRLEDLVTLAPEAITRVEAFMDRLATGWTGI